MDWKTFLQQESKQDYFQQLSAFLQEDSKQHTIYPPHKDMFNSFKLCPLDKTKVVILGQDPYINPGQAHGLCFSVPDGEPLPPSLRNIFKEMASDLSQTPPVSGCLIPWAKQGVLLLNTVMTVRQGQAGSHQHYGWEVFTDRAIQLVNQLEHPVVYLLWGSAAKSKKRLLTNPRHLVLEAAHPSPLSAHHGFFGCKHFSQCNEFLIKHQAQPIDWCLTLNKESA